MLRIGEFSRLSQVTVKALRHYHDIGLLRAARVDPQTHHRFYCVDQLPRIHRLVALKELGLSLQQIAPLLDSTADLSQLRGMLRLKQAETRQRLREEQRRLSRVAFRLRMLEHEEAPPFLDVVVKRVAAVRALTLRRTYADADVFQRETDELVGLVGASGVQLAGPAMEIHVGEAFTLTDLDVTLAGPVDGHWTRDVPVGRFGSFTVQTVAALDAAASYLHQGSLERLPEKQALVQRWAVANGYRIGNEVRLVFHRGPLHYRDETNLVEVQCGVDPAHAHPSLPTAEQGGDP